MGRIDNDETKGIALPFVILAHVRAGGTFCAHALSNHPQVYCDRGESVHHLSVWRKVAGMKPGRICRMLWAQTGYRAAGLRLIYNQAFHKRIWPVLEKVQPHVVHLRRRSLIRQALSQAYQQRVRAKAFEYHPVHTFEEREPPRQELEIPQALYFVRKIEKENRQGLERMAAYPGQVLEVFYEEMVGDAAGSANRMSPAVAVKICNFLGVDAPYDLRVDLRRDFPVPTPEMFANWPEVEAALKICNFLGVDAPYDLRVDLKRDFPVSTPEMFANWPEVEAALREAGYGDDVDYELDYGEQIGG